MPTKLPNGATVKTPEELGIDPNDAQAMQRYNEFYKSLTGTLYKADSMNKGALGVAGTAAVAGLVHGATGGSGTLPVAGGADSGPTIDPEDGHVIAQQGSPVSGGGNGIDFLGLVKQYGGDVLAALNVYESAQKQGQSDKYAQDAIKGTTDAYNAKAPLRALGIAGMQNPGANVPDLSNIRQLSTAGSGNPFAKALPVAGAATGFKAPPAVLPTAPPSPTNPATVTPGAALPPGAAALAGGLPGAPTPTAIPKRTIPVVGS